MERSAVTFDDIAADLRSLRAAAGSPSYLEIVVRIGRQRAAAGVDPSVSRPAKTTVYDAFRPGRRRLDVALVLEIAKALGASELEVDHWAERCRLARPASELAREAELSETPADTRTDTPTATGGFHAPGPRFALIVMLACLGVNILGRTLVDVLELPLYLDMVGTATSAMLLGPWYGATVGLATNLTGIAVSGWASLPFALVNVTGALVWGYGARHFAMARTLPRYAVLNLLAALACSLVATPIIVIVFGGAVGHAADNAIQQILATTHFMVVSVFAANLLWSVADKLLSGFVALVVLEASPQHPLRR